MRIHFLSLLVFALLLSSNALAAFDSIVLQWAQCLRGIASLSRGRSFPTVSKDSFEFLAPPDYSWIQFSIPAKKKGADGFYLFTVTANDQKNPYASMTWIPAPKLAPGQVLSYQIDSQSGFTFAHNTHFNFSNDTGKTRAVFAPYFDGGSANVSLLKPQKIYDNFPQKGTPILGKIPLVNKIFSSDPNKPSGVTESDVNNVTPFLLEYLRSRFQQISEDKTTGKEFFNEKELEVQRPRGIFEAQNALLSNCKNLLELNPAGKPAFSEFNKQTLQAKTNYETALNKFAIENKLIRTPPAEQGGEHLSP